ncbi:beta-ketoacyl synthase N-terminal-like domain-containing protein [Paenibacillus lutrae]|nr:beta-ketoacyl synthase N-terminal-like domain-containing protein [Paenibacillus lutrae]
MDKIARLILENVASGKLDKETGVELLWTLKQQEKKKAGDIAIIGLSMRMPDADNLEQYWDHIKNKRDSIRQFPAARQRDSKRFITNFTGLQEEDIQYSYGGYLNEVDGFDYGFFQLSPKEASLMDPNQRLFLQTAWEAIEDAGYGGKRLTGSRTGVYLGYADWPVYGQYITKNQPSHVDMASVGNTPSIIASRISYLLDLKGPAFLVDTACSSSLVAVHLACTALKNNECDMAIAGGVKVCLMPVDGVFEMGIESSNHRTSTFDDSSDGTVWGEGTVALLLKPLDQAMRDHDPIHAVIKGSAINQDGTSVGITAPSAASQEKLLIQAWEAAGIDPETITYIEAHGTGTRLGDPIEVDGIRRAFRHYTDKKQFCALGSVKTNVGHLDAASGVAGLAKAIAALKNKQLPPTIHFTKPNRNIPFEHSPVYVSDRAEEWNTDGFPRRCGVSSFGFSGTNCHVILEEAPIVESQAEASVAGEEIVALSAKSKAALEELIRMYLKDLPDNQASLHDICYTANTGRGHYCFRLAVIARSKEELIRQLQRAADEGLEKCNSYGMPYGEHRLVNAQRDDRMAGELTADELRRYTGEAGELTSRFMEQPPIRSQLDQLGRYYVQGADVNWELVYSSGIGKKARLPYYPFQNKRCWIEFGQDVAAEALPLSPARKEDGQNRADAAESAPQILLKGRQDERYSPMEKKLALVWGQLLGIQEIDIYDDFFELGGNSILAIKMEVDLEGAGIAFNSNDMYAYRTIKEAAAHLMGLGTGLDSQVEIKPDPVTATNETEQLAGNSRDVAASDPLPSAVKILPDMEPFNDIFYRNCLYNSMFPVVRHFNRSVLPFLLNDMILFTGEQGGDQMRYTVEYVSVHAIEEVFAQLMLQVDTRSDNTDIRKEIIASVSQGKPVVVWVDSYYESIRKDAYLTQHLDHTLLVYGYDEEEQLFHIIEHDRRENLSYKKCTLSFGDMEKACQGFTDHYLHQDHSATHYVFDTMIPEESAGNELTVNAAPALLSRFAQNMLSNRNKLSESLNVLKRFGDDFQYIISSEDLMKEHIQHLVDFVNQVINTKHVENYRLSLLFPDEDEVLLLLQRLLSKWDLVRKGIVRYMYLPVYQLQSLQAIHEKVRELAEDEAEFTTHLLSKLEPYREKTTV